MNLVATIINELVDTTISLTSPLLKTQVLASRIKNKELLDWVTQELNGYQKKEELPNYRKTHGKLTATYINGNYQFNDQILSTIQFGREMDLLMREITLPQSLETLESLSNGHHNIGIDFNAEIIRILQNSFEENNPYMQIISARCTTSISFVKDILATVRSKLLQLMLKIEEELGAESEIENIKGFNKEITKIMNNTIINNGDGNVTNTGEHSKIDANIKIKKGDQSRLSSTLKENKVNNDDIRELLSIIDLEQPKAGVFGLKVNNWVQKMVGKALDGTWQIGIATAGVVLGEALNHYYGIVQ